MHIHFARKMTREIKAKERTIRSKTHKAQGALTAASEERNDNRQT